MNELKFFKGSIDNWDALSKNSNYFYLVINGDVLELYLGDKLVAKSSTPDDLKSEVERLDERIDNLVLGDLDLSNYYTKEEVDDIIYENITKVLNTPT